MFAQVEQVVGAVGEHQLAVGQGEGLMGAIRGAVAGLLGVGPLPPEWSADGTTVEVLRWVLGLAVVFCVLDSVVLTPLARRRERREAREQAAQPVIDPYDLESVAVYRLYGAGGFLLYVGIASDPKRRFSQHADDKPWWRDVAQWEVEWFRDRATAAAEEAAAIVNEAPAYNVASAPEPRKSDRASAGRMLADIDGLRRVKAEHLNLLFVHYVRALSIPDDAHRPFWRRDHIATVYWHAYERAGEVSRVFHHRFANWWKEQETAGAALLETRRCRERAAQAAQELLRQRPQASQPKARPTGARRPPRRDKKSYRERIET